MKKNLYIMLIFFIILSSLSNVFAAELKTKLDVIQQSAETKYLENDQGYITKSIVDSNAETGEVTVEMSLNNTTINVSEEVEQYENNEIYIIVYEDIVTNEEVLSTYISYIDTLTTSIFAKNSNTKIGIIGIKGTIADYYFDENGKRVEGENDEGDVEGTADNAEIVVNLTDNAETIKTGLQNMNSSKNGHYPNLQAAIRLANNSYSEKANKLLICIYDGAPNIAIGVMNTIYHGGWFSEYDTAEEAAIGKYQKIASKTKSEILNLKSNNIDFILLRPDDTSYNLKSYDKNGELSLEFDGSPYVQEIYGTLENPTYGKMYSLNNDTLEKVVTEYIYQDIMKEISPDIKSAVVKEYFSDDILKNFDITFNNENIDTTNLLNDKYISWNIGNLPGNETISLKYTLKIKDMKNTELLNKVLLTNEKTEMTYINYLDVETTISSTSSPKIQLSEIKEELTATVSYDPTTNTTGKVTAIIKTNKKVNAVDGWTISEDGMTLTKEYSANSTETVHLVDIDGRTKDVVITISNIIAEEQSKIEEDKTTSNEILPNTGVNMAIIFSLIAIMIISIIVYKKFNSYKEIK